MQLRYGTAAEAGMSTERMKLARELCRTWIDKDVHKALSVLVARRGVICLHEAFGNIGPHGAPPLERDSIFPVMSITKVFTATALMTLVEDGLVGLTRPVQEYIPEFKSEGKEHVLVHHLLTHTSGLTEWLPDLLGVSSSEAEDPSPSEPSQHPRVAASLQRTLVEPLSKSPGEEMFYSNLNYVLAGEIVRRVAGCALADFAASRLFEPLGMKDTFYVLPVELFDRTIGWSILPPGLDQTTTREFRQTPHPAGGVFSTPMDMAVFGQTFLNGGCYGNARVLSPATVAEMTRDQIPGIPATFAIFRNVEASWGYGWSVTGNAKWPGWPTFPRGTFNHSGAAAMMLWADPTNEIVGAFCSICRYKGTIEAPEPVTNVDLFVNVVTAAAEK